MHRHRHVGGATAHGVVDQLGVDFLQALGILANGAHMLMDLGIAEEGEIGLVDLHVTAPRRIERRQLLPVDPCEIVEIVGHIRIGLGIDARPATAEMHQRGRGQRLFGGEPGLVRMGLQIRKFLAGQRPCTRKLAFRDNHWRRHDHRPAFVLECGLEPALEGHALDALDEIHEPMAPMIFAIGADLKTNGFLQHDRFIDGGAFDSPKLVAPDLACGKPLPRRPNAIGTQERTNHIRLEWTRHAKPPNCFFV